MPHSLQHHHLGVPSRMRAQRPQHNTATQGLAALEGEMWHQWLGHGQHLDYDDALQQPLKRGTACSSLQMQRRSVAAHNLQREAALLRACLALARVLWGNGEPSASARGVQNLACLKCRLCLAWRMVYGKAGPKASCLSQL